MSKKTETEARVECGESGGDDEICLRRLSETDRRQLLRAVAGGGTLALAGCVGIFSDPEAEQPPGADDDDAPDDDGDGPTLFDVEYTVQGETIEVPENENLLEAGEEQGWELPYQCRSGFCGQCMGQVDGDGHDLVEMTTNDYDPLDDDAISDGYVLTCTGQPRGDFALETGVIDAFENGDEEDDEVDDDDPDVDAFDIEYVEQGETIEVPEDENLLEAGEEQGWELPYQCRVGVCGECLAQVDGDGHDLVEMTDNDYGPLDDDAISDGYVLTCTGQPRDEFALETGKAGELE